MPDDICRLDQSRLLFFGDTAWEWETVERGADRNVLVDSLSGDSFSQPKPLADTWGLRLSTGKSTLLNLSDTYIT